MMKKKGYKAGGMKKKGYAKGKTVKPDFLDIDKYSIQEFPFNTLFGIVSIL